jgi:glycerol-3-phosphate cytidylyltransferase|tara:strand:+ start:614 stop:1045 length:432 start_codon:yes stop_codon:yes gene_type:complete
MKENKVGITFGSFDLFHAGHVFMLEEAKTVCDYLIVGLQIDPTLDRPDVKNKPVQNIVERQVQLRGCKYIDEIILYNTEQELLDILNTIKWDIRIIGEEYKSKHFTGKELSSTVAGSIHFNKRKHGFSSTSLRKRVTESQFLS